MLVVMLLMMMHLMVLHNSILNLEDTTTEHQQANHPIPAAPTYHQNTGDREFADFNRTNIATITESANYPDTTI